MNDDFFVSRMDQLYNECTLSRAEKKSLALLTACACDTDERENAIEDYLKKDGITLESLGEYVSTLLPPVEIVED